MNFTVYKMETTRESIRDRIIRLSNLLTRATMGEREDINGTISREILLDSLLVLYDECNNEFLMKDTLIAEFVEKYRSTVLKLRDFCIGISDFDWLKVISLGRFAEVTVVKEKNTNNVYVAKRLRKSDILNSHETIHFENEKNVLLAAATHNEARKWVPQLLYSFHNLKYIYYIMEYCPGGNLYTMLEYYKKNVPESMLRFYMAEMVQAISSIHNLGFAHRDIKPDNITIDASGHLKLIDFGSSARIPKNGLINTKLSLTMPHYTAPEVFKFHDNLSKGYYALCDWWSLGVVLFELTTGSVPFTSDEVPKLYLSTYMKKLQYPKLVDIPLDLKNIINNLLQPIEKRLNYEKIKRLNYFSNINWQSLHQRDPLFLPSLSSPEDTSYFTTYESQRPTPKVEDFKLQRRFTGRGLRFLGFTYLGNSSNETVQLDSLEGKNKEVVRGRRKTEDYKKSIPESKEFLQRHSLDSAVRLSEATTSEYSNDSYESATSVRLENEVNQLHSFYNEKALIIEEKLKTRFHDIYSCMTEDQQKILREKEQLMIRVNEMEKELVIQLEEIKTKTKELEDERENLQNQIKQLNEANDDLKNDYEAQIIKLKRTDKLKKDTIAKLNGDLQKLNKELSEKAGKLKETEERLLNLSNQQAAKLAMLNRTKTTLRSKSEERDKYEHENVTLKNQLTDANKKIANLTTELEKKNKLKLDLELKMTAKDRNGERTFTTQGTNQKSPVEQTMDTEQLVKQITNSVRDVLKENLTRKGEDKTPDIEKMIGTIQNKISSLNDHFKAVPESEDKSAVESTVITLLRSQIEHLQSQVKKAEETSSFHRDEVDQLRRELTVNEKQLADTKIELRVAQREVKVLEEQIKVLQANKVDSEQLMKNFQSTIKDMIEENLRHKEAIKNPDFEGMFNKVQRKLSVLSESHAKTLETETKPNSNDENTNVQVLHAQIERLEIQMEKARERAILSREEATQAKSKLAITEKQLSDLKIDLRIAQRETKDAENQAKELEEKLKAETLEFVTQLEALQQKLKERELEVVTLKNTVDAKTNEVKLHEISLEDKTSVIHSLSKEVQAIKMKIENLRQEKAKIEAENKKRVHESTKLKTKVEQLENTLKKNESNVNQIQQKENEWKSKYEKIKIEVESLRETCEIQDRINVGFETKQKTLEDEISRYEEEKIKLQEELESVCEELKHARKSINEEKSLRAVAEDRLRKLQEGLRLQEEEIRLLKENEKEKLHEMMVLEEKIKQFEDCIFETNDSMQKSTQYIELMKKEVYLLKEERTELLTRLHKLKEEKISLQNELTEAIEEINSLQQINGESQVVLDQIKAYYEDRHIKDTATLHQYSKLNEFLQTKVYDATKQKRTFTDKFFRSKHKENLNPKEIENLLYLERKKNKELADQLYQTKTEIIMQRNNENSSSTKCSSPKNTEYESCISATPTVSSRTRLVQSNDIENESSLRARMKHNIPHKFDTKLCKKLGIKCVVCGQAVTFGHMSQCKECHVRCHVACSVRIGPTCGLSKLLMNQLPIMAPTKTQSSVSLGSSIKSDIESHVRVLKNKSWEKMNIVINENDISFYEKPFKQQKEALENINLSLIIDVDDHVDKSHVALENFSDMEKRCLFRIIYGTSSREERIVHLLAPSEDDKLNWINIIRRNLPTVPKQVSFKLETKDHSRGTVICEFDERNTLVMNQIISLLPELILMATNNGLYSLRTNIQNDHPNLPIRINGVDKVVRIKILTKLRLVLFVCGEDNLVKKCDLRMLLSNAEAAACSLPSITTEDVSSITPINDCELLEASSCNSLLAIATTNRLVILKTTQMGFDAITYDKEIYGVKSMVFTPHCLLYCTHSEVFKVNLKTYDESKLEVFKRCPDGDTKCQQSLKAIVKITRELYLVCNQLFGVFINAEGRKRRNSERLRWPIRPEQIVYNKPFLYLGHESNISLVYLPPSGEESKKLKFSIIPYCKPSILGIIKEPVNGEYMKDPVRGIFIEDEKEEGNKLLYFLDPIVFTRYNPKDSWSSIDTQLTGETTDEECIRKSLNVSNETDLSLNSSVLDESCDEQSP